MWFKNNILKIIIISLLLKILYLLFAIVINDYIPNKKTLTLNVKSYINISWNNDSGWYERIAKKGYPVITNVKDIGYSNGKFYTQSEWAFFPFYSLILKSTNQLLQIDFSICEFILSIIFSILAFTGFYIFCVWFLSDTKLSFFLTLVLMFFPFHYYFSMFYTESIFFTFMIFSFIAIVKKKYLILSLLLIPLTLVRPNGILILLPLFLFLFEQNNILIKYNFNLKKIFKKNMIFPTLSFISGPIVFISWCYYQKQMTGELFAFSIAQKGWYRELMFPLFAFFRRGDFVTQFYSYYTIIIILISIIAWKKFPLSLNILIWISLIIPLCSGSVISMQRFISVIFPLTIYVGSWLYKIKYRYFILPLLLCFQLSVFYYWLLGHPFSY